MKINKICLICIAISTSVIVAGEAFFINAQTLRSGEVSYLPSDIKEKIEKLNSLHASKRIEGAHALGKMGPAAVLAIPSLIDLLGDDAVVNDYEDSRGGLNLLY